MGAKMTKQRMERMSSAFLFIFLFYMHFIIYIYRERERERENSSYLTMLSQKKTDRLDYGKTTMSEPQAERDRNTNTKQRYLFS